MERLLIALIVTFILSCKAATDNCSGGCSCSTVSGDNGIVASCKVDQLHELVGLISRPFDVKSLDIKSNELMVIPKGSFRNFTNLVNLNLGCNRIRTIEDGAFSNLSNLQRLNLSFNQLKDWQGNFTDELDSLMFLDVTGNRKFEIPQKLLTLRSLNQIDGVNWSEFCTECSLVKNYSSENNENIKIDISDVEKGEYLVGNKVHCRVKRHQVSGHVVEFAKDGFFPRCLETDKTCFKSEVQITPIHRCWDLDNKILNIAYFISPPAMVLNVIVVLVTLTTSALRRNVSLFLATNMAVSDFLISLYTLILISFRKMPYTDFLLVERNLCNTIGFVWLTGQIVSINTSVLLTIERFLVIIYCMKPNIRLTRRKAVALAAMNWLLALIVATLPLVKISVYTSNTYCVPIRPIKDIPHSYEMSIGLALWGMLLYISTIPLYIMIYRAVKTSSDRIGVKRDGALAKRIAIMVLSNMLFLFLPILIGFIWLVANLDDHMSPQSREILTGVFGTLCLSFNSFLNPLLYAFRAEKFRKALVMKFNTVFLRKPRGQSLSHSHQSQMNRDKPRGRTLSSIDGGNHEMILKSENGKKLVSVGSTRI